MLHCHRSLRALAEACAALGLPSLRLDYAACGNSADAMPATTTQGHHAIWLASIEAGIEHLRARSGVAQVALLAVRSGVLLAAAVAARSRDVVALVALAPVCSGRFAWPRPTPVARPYPAMSSRAKPHQNACCQYREESGTSFR